MSNTVIKIENLSKIYRLGEVGTGTLSHDLNRWWKMNILGKEDPYAKIGHVNDRTQKAEKGELVAALRDINLEVKQGEVLGIIGKNGAGKSTLLKLLSRVTSPTTGSIKTKGRLASLLEVGTGFHPEMTGRENIYMNGTIMGMRKWEISNKLDEIVDFAGVAKYLDTPTKRYSSGMTVRLGFAIAAFLEPEILVVDEVLAVGDAEFQKKAIGKMQDVSKGDGRTVLFVSHNMASVKTLCTSGILLENGSMKFSGTTEEAVGIYLKGENVNSTISIKERKDRSGNGKIQFSKIEIFNKLNQKVESAISCEFIQLKIHIDIKEKVEEKLIFTFNIKDQNEEIKAMVVSEEMPVNINDIIKKGYINIVIDKLLLRGGRYNFNLALGGHSLAKENLIDVVQNAFTLDVLPGDLYKIGNLNRAYSAIVLPCFLN
jgi:lipopolysaccharide transport system ATP-binding protein